MNHLRWLGLATALLLAAGCAATSPPHAESEAAPGVDLTHYRTFSWAETPGYGTGGSQAPLRLYEQNIRTALAAELVKRGYVESADHPDLRFATESATRDTVKSNPVTFGIGVGSWGGNVGTSVGVGTSSVESYSEGRLTIRAVDAEINKEVWVGTVAGRMKERLEAKDMARLVAMAMQDFPTRH